MVCQNQRAHHPDEGLERDVRGQGLRLEVEGIAGTETFLFCAATMREPTWR